MTPLELATILNGRQYLDEITEEEEALAAQNRLVVVFGYSDDCVELRGAIMDELGGYGDVEFFVTKDGILENRCSNEYCPCHNELYTSGYKIEGRYGAIPAWEFVTEIPHEVFMIYEDGDEYCEGIVFSLDNLGPLPQPSPPTQQG